MSSFALHLLYPSSTPLPYHLLHDTFALALHAAELTVTAFLLHSFYVSGSIVYFITLLSLLSVSLICLALFFSIPYPSPHLCHLLLGLPFASLTPFLIVPSYYIFPSCIPSPINSLFHHRPSKPPTSHSDPTRAYLNYKLTQHASLHLHSILFTLPSSIVLLIFICSHSDDLTWVHTALLLIQISIFSSRTQAWTFSVHPPTMCLMLTCLALDTCNLYSYVLLLASSTPSQATLPPPYFFHSYSHPSVLNVLMLCKDMTLLLIFAFAFVLLLLAFALKDLHLAPPASCRVVGLMTVKWWLALVSGLTLFVPLVLTMKVMKGTWVVIGLYVGLEYQIALWPVFYRRLHRFLTGDIKGWTEGELSGAEGGQPHRLYLTHRFFASKCLTLYPPPACINDRRRHFISHALHTLSLTPHTFDAPTLKALEYDEGHRLSWAEELDRYRRHLFNQFPTPPTRIPLWSRVMHLTGVVILYFCIPLYTLSVLFDLLYPIAAGVWLGVDGGWAGGVTRLALIIVCLYTALCVVIVMLTPSVRRFHRLMGQVILYDLPQQQTLVESNTKDVPEGVYRPPTPPSDVSSPSASMASAPSPLPPLSPPWSLADDHLTDWPFQLSSLLYSSYLSTNTHATLQSLGLPPPITSLIVSYLPPMERERAGAGEEEMEWKERRRRRRRERRRASHSYEGGDPWGGGRAFLFNRAGGGGEGEDEEEMDDFEIVDPEVDLRLQRQVAAIEMGRTRPRHFHQWQREVSDVGGGRGGGEGGLVIWEQPDEEGEEKKEEGKDGEGDVGEKEDSAGVMQGMYGVLVGGRRGGNFARFDERKGGFEDGVGGEGEDGRTEGCYIDIAEYDREQGEEEKERDRGEWEDRTPSLRDEKQHRLLDPH